MSNAGYESNAANRAVATGNAALARLQRSQRNANELVAQGKTDLAATRLAEAQAAYNVSIRRPSAERASRSRARTPPNKVAYVKAFTSLPYSKQDTIKASENYQSAQVRITELEGLLESKNVSAAEKNRYKNELGGIYAQLLDFIQTGGRRQRQRQRQTRRRR
jgi:hypothetical protein